MLRNWNTTHSRNYLGLIDGDVRRRPTRGEHPKTDHRDSEERQLRSAMPGKRKLQFRTVRHHWRGSSSRVCGRSVISHVSHHLISLATVNIRTIPLGLRCPLSHHVSYAQGSGGKGCKAIPQEVGCLPNLVVCQKIKERGGNRSDPCSSKRPPVE